MAHPPESNPIFFGIGSFGYLIRRLTQLMTERIEARFTGEAVTFSQFLALAIVNAGEADTAADVARFLGHDAGATTRLIDHLEHRGLMTRERSTEDRRVIHLTVTAEGKTMIRQCGATGALFQSEVLSDIKPADLAHLVAQLRGLVEKVQTIPVDPLPRRGE